MIRIPLGLRGTVMEICYVNLAANLQGCLTGTQHPDAFTLEKECPWNLDINDPNRQELFKAWCFKAVALIKRFLVEGADYC